MLCPASASALADAVAGLAASPRARERLARGGLAAVRERTWEASLAALGAGWMQALATRAAAAHEVARRMTRSITAAPTRPHPTRPAPNLKGSDPFRFDLRDATPFAHLPDSPFSAQLRRIALAGEPKETLRGLTLLGSDTRS